MIIRLTVDQAAELWAAADSQREDGGSEWDAISRKIDAALDRADPDWIDNTSEDCDDDLFDEAIRSISEQKAGKVIGGDTLVHLDLTSEEMEQLLQPRWA